MTREIPEECKTDDQAIEGLEPGNDDVSGLVSILSDAYDAPSVPKSLVERLENGIESQWGQPPGLVVSRLAQVTDFAKTGRGWVRSASVGIGLAAALLLAFFVATGTGNNVWASVIEAIKQNGLIRMEHQGTIRWLDLDNKIACEQTNEQTRWFDFERRILLVRDSGEENLRRSKLPSFDHANTDSLLAAFLLGEPLSGHSLDRFVDVEVMSEKTQRVSVDGRDFVDLAVRLRTSDGIDHALSLQLDAKSNVPYAVTRVKSTPNDPISLTLVSQSSVELKEDYFPKRMKLVDVLDNPSARVASLDRQNVPTEQMAALDDKKLDRPNSIEATSPKDSLDQNQSVANNLAANNPAVSNPATNDNHASPASTFVTTSALPMGAANKWKPVAVVSRSNDEVIKQVNWVLKNLWKEQGVDPSKPATDLQLLRRLYLDVAGRIPSVTEVRRFDKDARQDRYEKLVDSLLESPDFATQMAAVWRSFLIPEGVELDAFGGRASFEKWMSERFIENEPYDQTVRKLLLAEGRLVNSGPLLFYAALKLDADQLAAKTSRAFLGMRLECAQCHDHPFEPWSQEDFWSYAAFFAQISRPNGELENASTVMRVSDVDRGQVMLPETDDVVFPRFLGKRNEQADVADQSSNIKNTAPRRRQLADWLTGADNPYFARATVNRVWAHLFGRGIVDPVDDFGMNNEAVSPELLDTLASHFIESKFDIRKLVRTIVLSDAYRLSSNSTQLTDEVAESNDDEPRLKYFAQMNVKTLTAEQMFDCISVATLMQQQNRSQGQYVTSRFDNGARNTFLQQFSAPAENRAEYLAGIPQALTLMNGSLTSGVTHEKTSGLIRSLDAPFFTHRQRLDVLFLSTLSRPPSDDEILLLSDVVPESATSEEKKAAMSDLLWALINSAEFTLNH